MMPLSSLLAAIALALAAQGAGLTATQWRPVQFVELTYPPQALAARIIGFVVVEVTIDDQGRVTSSEVLAGPPQLAAAADANAKQWVFAPRAQRTALVYRFDIDPGRCSDDTRSLFRLESGPLATIVACTGPNRPLGMPGWQWDVPVIDIPRIEYPDIAFTARFQGTVVVRIAIAGNGTVTSATVVAGVPLLAEAAVSHAKTWRFEPTTPREQIIVYEFAQMRGLRTEESCGKGTINEMVYASYIRVSAASPCIQV